jgi:hypothetical protein
MFDELNYFHSSGAAKQECDQNEQKRTSSGKTRNLVLNRKRY